MKGLNIAHFKNKQTMVSFNIVILLQELSTHLMITFLAVNLKVHVFLNLPLKLFPNVTFKRYFSVHI